jgi:hypothetical protein
MRLNTKINRHERVAQLMLSGKPVSPEQFELAFKGTDQEAVIYRLSTNIYNIRKDGGIIKVIKDGRKVTGYQLVNIDEFNPNGRYTGRKPQVKKPVEVEQELEIAY